MKEPKTVVPFMRWLAQTPILGFVTGDHQACPVAIYLRQLNQNRGSVPDTVVMAGENAPIVDKEELWETVDWVWPVVEVVDEFPDYVDRWDLFHAIHRKISVPWAVELLCLKCRPQIVREKETK